MDAVLDDQLGAIAEREGVECIWLRRPETRKPNAMQCASEIVKPWYRWGTVHVLWRPIVEAESSAEAMHITLKGTEREIEPARLIVDRLQATLHGGGETTVVEHGGAIDRVGEASTTLGARMQEIIREVRLGRYERETKALVAKLRPKPAGESA